MNLERLLVSQDIPRMVFKFGHVEPFDFLNGTAGDTLKVTYHANS